MDERELSETVEEVSQRLAALEAAVEAMGREVQTEHLIVTDGHGQARIEMVAKDRWAELKIRAQGALGGHAVEVCAFAGADDPTVPAELSASVGLWVDGNHLAGLVLPPLGSASVWCPHLYVDGGDGADGSDR